MTNDKEEFLEKFKRGIRDVSVGQYNDKYINIGYKPLYEEMWNWIESKLKAKDEEIEKVIDESFRCGWELSSEGFNSEYFDEEYLAERTLEELPKLKSKFIKGYDER